MPNGRLTYKRGEIWWIDLKPVVGHETDKEHPCLILQNDIGNQNGTTTVVAPLDLLQKLSYRGAIGSKYLKAPINWT
jgi:hypothetical protein